MKDKSTTAMITKDEKEREQAFAPEWSSPAVLDAVHCVPAKRSQLEGDRQKETRDLNPNMKFFPRLRELRVRAGYSQSEIASVLDMQQNQYSRYERGDRELPMHLFVRLAVYYGVSLDYIVGLSNHPHS